MNKKTGMHSGKSISLLDIYIELVGIKGSAGAAVSDSYEEDKLETNEVNIHFDGAADIP